MTKIYDNTKIHHDLVYQPFRNIESENNIVINSNENKYQIFAKSIKGTTINSKTVSKIRRIS